MASTRKPSPVASVRRDNAPHKAGVRLWRIATETRAYKAADLSGAGAAVAPGRWNQDRQPVVYCALTLSLAVLETAAHMPDAGLPLNRFVICIDVPAALWRARRQYGPHDLDAAWAAIPAGQTSAGIGSAWLQSLQSVLLLVPSVIVPEESAVLINPAHADAVQLQAQVVRPFDYGRLFRR